MKGVPRILKADSTALRSLWLVAFIGFFTVCLYQSYKLTEQFLSGEKVIVLHEGLSSNADEYAFISPKYTICNLSPLSTDKSRYDEISNLQNYFEKVINVTKCVGCPRILLAARRKLRRALWTPWGYGQYIGQEAVKKVGHQKKDFIIDCKALIDDEVVYPSTPCDEIFVMMHDLSTIYFNCYTLTYKKNLHPDVRVKGVTLVVYLDNPFHEDFSEFEHFDMLTGEGAIVAVNPGEDLPIMHLTGLDVAPGRHTTVRIRATERTRMDKPQGYCRKNMPAQFIQPYADKRKLEYSSNKCINMCLATAVARLCGCNDYSLLHVVPAVGRFVANKSCADIRVGQTLLFRWTACSAHVKSEHRVACSKLCPLPCIEKIYRAEITSSRWPPFAKRQLLYDVMKSRGIIHESMPEQLLNQSVYTTNAYNFLKVSIRIDNLNHVEVEDKEKNTLAGFFSQLGGTLNLWTGITVFVLVEIIETLYRLMTSIVKRNDPIAKGTPGNVDNVQEADPSETDGRSQEHEGITVKSAY